jgi:hypothetical protein
LDFEKIIIDQTQSEANGNASKRAFKQNAWTNQHEPDAFSTGRRNCVERVKETNVNAWDDM